MHVFSNRKKVEKYFKNKRVAIVGSGPGCLDNEAGFIDSHDVVVRVNNHKLSLPTGFRTDVHYSFYGLSIKKTPEELKAEGVKLCLCKCPNEKFMESEWHRRVNKPRGVDFRPIYEEREDWWFCPTYVPPVEEFMDSFNLLQQHIPTTGFSAIVFVDSFSPASVYLTGFDFFSSKVHNVNERWRPGNPYDPIGHRPDLELQWLVQNRERFSFDEKLSAMVAQYG